VIFSSLTFMAFLIVLIGVIAMVRQDRARKIILLLASYIFYAAWEVEFLTLIIGCSLWWSWWLGLLMYQSNSVAKKKALLALSLTLDLAMLGYFKYANFFIDSFTQLLGIENAGALNIILPVGISFFTFQAMSYNIDLYRGNIQLCRDLIKFLLFVAFFPQLVAGPVVRASEFLPQLDQHVRLHAKNITIGAQIFIIGLLQKSLVGDNLSKYVDPVFSNPAMYDTATLWTALAAYSVQIFCDFSGYTLMAIGVARMFGFELPTNFRMPYLSLSITEFWRRWHMTLSRWLRDYLYISLGGSRKGEMRTNVNLMLTMLLGGLWHGSSWNFVLWGGLHGLGLVIHRYWRNVSPANYLNGAPLAGYNVLCWAVTLVYICLLWVPFRCTDFSLTGQYFSGLFTPTDGIHWLHTSSVVLLVGVAIWHLIYQFNGRMLNTLPSEQLFQSYRPLMLVGLMLLSLALFAPNETSPFIYFQF